MVEFCVSEYGFYHCSHSNEDGGWASGETVDYERVDVLTCLQVGVWVSVGVCHVRAVYRRRLLWPGRDEARDRDE